MQLKPYESHQLIPLSFHAVLCIWIKLQLILIKMLHAWIWKTSQEIL